MIENIHHHLHKNTKKYNIIFIIISYFCQFLNYWLKIKIYLEYLIC